MSGDDFFGILFLTAWGYVIGLMMGGAVDSDRAQLQARIMWADKACLPHGGADSVDTSMAFGSREATCKDGTEIHAGGNGDKHVD